jgi:hypothetical protein
MWIQRNFSERFVKIAPIESADLGRQAEHAICIHFAAFRMGYFWPLIPG